MDWLQPLEYGWVALAEYLSAHVLTCLVPAFFIAGAIPVFVSQNAVLRYFGLSAPRPLAHFAALVGIVIFGSWGRWIETGVFAAGLVVVVGRWFSWDEVKAWLLATWHFVRQIVPWLLGGIVVAGMIRGYVPETWIAATVGGNSVVTNAFASVVGAFFYTATLTEVPIVRSFMDLGMHQGPVLALLLAGPALSLPNVLVVRSVLGTRKTLSYLVIVVALVTLGGWTIGTFLVH